MKLDILAVAAHPDDVELTCGGTLIKMAQKGYKTGILDLTAGEMGTRGSVKLREKVTLRRTRRSVCRIRRSPTGCIGLGGRPE